MENKINVHQTLWNLLCDPLVEDISISSVHGIQFYKNAKWNHYSDLSYGPSLDAFTKETAFQIAELAGVSLNSRHPSLDTQIHSYKDLPPFRAHVVIPPLSGTGTLITLRRLNQKNQMISLSHFYMNAEEKRHLELAVYNKKSILICGATGSGKTSFLKALINLCQSDERIAILEDSAEIEAPNRLSFCLRSRSNRFGALEGSTWNLEQLVYECLRMRPDRIVLGECRGPEALGLLHAMQSGHQGVMCTIHASNPNQALERYKNLVRLATHDCVELSNATWNLVVVVDKNQTGQRTAAVFDTKDL